MLILNYSHPLTADQLDQLAELTGEPIDVVRDLPAQLDLSLPFAQHAAALADAAALSPAEWQTQRLLVVMPSLNFAALALLAEIHGRAGYFVPVVRLRPIAGALPPRFEIAEILDLQSIRERARTRRAG